MNFGRKSIKIHPRKDLFPRHSYYGRNFLIPSGPPELNHLSLAIYHLDVDNPFLEAKFNKTDFSDVRYESMYDFSDESDMKLF